MLKNLLLVFVAFLSVYLYQHPRVETRVVTQAAVPVVVKMPVTPTPEPPTYYHSPLDASAMSTSYSTGSGYFSNDRTSRFNSGSYNGPTYGGSASAVGGYPAYYYPSGSSNVSNTVIYNVGTGGRAVAQPTPFQGSYIAGRLPTR